MLICLFVPNEKNLEINTWPPSRYQAYRNGVSIFAWGPWGPREKVHFEKKIADNKKA